MGLDSKVRVFKIAISIKRSREGRLPSSEFVLVFALLPSRPLPGEVTQKAGYGTGLGD